MAKLGGREEYPFYFGAGTELMRIAGDLRKSTTPAEKVLWNQLRNRKVQGFRFRRQHPIKDFIVDFFCYDAMLVIEVDGSVHQEARQKERDEQRTLILKRLGIGGWKFKYRPSAGSENKACGENRRAFFIGRKHDQTIFDGIFNVTSSDRLFGI